MKTSIEESLAAAAEVIGLADAILIGAGAGMGVDSGLPDFRGSHGFWSAYPPYKKLGLDFRSLANPRWFREDPQLAWGFYGHRLNLYRDTEPHQGFAILKKWSDDMTHGAFIYTSNVDGQFQRAGFATKQIVEVHGAIDWLQCMNECGIGIFSADPFQVELDDSTMHAAHPLPKCPKCGELARPNILMFGDGDFDGSRSQAQLLLLRDWLGLVAGGEVVIIECGAGTSIPSVRMGCEDIARKLDAKLIRINPDEAYGPPGTIEIPLRALEALEGIDDLISA